MQMTPHFLFNAFNTIAMMIWQKKNEEVVEMIGSMSDKLRISLNKEFKFFVKLKEEVNLLKKYLSIESLRYKGPLHIEWYLDEGALKYMFPNIIL